MFTHINSGKVTAREISQSIHTDERATEMLLNALVSLELLEKQENRYDNSRISSVYLVKGMPYYQGDFIHYFHSMMDNWAMLRETVETGRAILPENLPEEVDSDSLRGFINAMHNIAAVKAEEICNKIDLKDAGLLLDLAGGPGTYAITFAKANPNLHAVVFDLEHVIKLTKEFIKASNMEGRVTTQSGNCLENNLGKNIYDVIFVSNFLHSFNPENNKKILKKCWHALKDDGQIIIHDFVLDETKTHPQFAALFNLNMLIGTEEGASYSEREYRAWLECTGFKQMKKIDLESNCSIIIGKK